ncbi:MAG: phage head-tail connector protein [Sphingomonadaceae bacterium]|nr:phage head-tail connector protein [Sphingomonadaceae bacterium]
MADLLPPATVPVALDEVKAFLRLDDGSEDALIAGFIRTATALAEAFTGQRLIVRDVADAVLPVRVWQRLPAFPVIAIAGVSGDGQPLPGGAIETDIDLGGTGWVRLVAPDLAVRYHVLYSAGIAADWNGVPEPLRQGIVRLVAHLHTHRDDPDSGPPAAVAALWRPWRRLRLGAEARHG